MIKTSALTLIASPHFQYVIHSIQGIKQGTAARSLVLFYAL